MHAYRTHTCGALRAADAGQAARLSGWVHSKRDHGGLLFIDLRDHYGMTQCVFASGTPAFAIADKLRAESVITVTVTTERQERSVSGTVYADGKPRLIDVKGIRVDAEFGPSMIYVTNEDKPGFIGRFASLLGNAGVNIATFALGRDAQGGSAIALVEVDGEPPSDVLSQIPALPGVKQAKALRF